MIATCRHCGEIFDDPAVIAESTDATFSRFFRRLGRHLERKHQDKLVASVQATQMAAANLGGMILLDNFSTTDEKMERRRLETCAEIGRLVGRRVTDEEIEERIRRAGFGRPDWVDSLDAIRRIMRELRNYLTYADVQIPASPSVKASAVVPDIVIPG